MYKHTVRPRRDMGLLRVKLHQITSQITGVRSVSTRRMHFEWPRKMQRPLLRVTVYPRVAHKGSEIF